jgi:rhodanese-related sulfurtransferase
MNGRGAVTSISFDQFYPLHEAGKTMVFDARHPFFYRIGHIPGAINLPLPDCDTSIHKREDEIKTALAEGKTIVVYCSGITCPDARSVARHISGFGYPASVFSGGWDAWNEAGLTDKPITDN